MKPSAHHISPSIHAPPKKNSLDPPTGSRKRSMTDVGSFHSQNSLKDQLKQVNDILLTVEIIFKETHSPKDIDERKPLQKALTDTLNILESLQIKEFEQSRTLQVGNKFSARLQNMNRGPSDQNIVTAYRLATSSTLRDIKTHLNALQSSISKDQHLNTHTCVLKLKEIQNILQEGLNQFYAHRRVVFKLHRSLYIKVAEAKGLPAMDLGGTSDPFVEILVDNEKKARTRTIRKTLEPCWLEEFDILLKPESKELCIKVYDEDLKKDDFIGQVLIDIDSLKDGATYEQWLNLMPKAKRTEGSIHLILKYLPNTTENFIVQVLNGTKLAPDKGPIDAMCKVMIMEPGKGKTNVFKTDVIKKTENPVWAATFKMTLEPDQLVNNNLLLVVRAYDNAKLGFLGQISIPLSNFVTDVNAESYCSQWFHLYPKPPKNEKKLGAIRLQLRYQEERILPDECYDKLFEVLNTKDLDLILLMQKFVPNTSEKKILFSSIVAAFEGKGKAVQLIDTLTTLDMEQIKNPDVLFRGNSLGSICLDSYQKLTCSHLLEGEFLRTIKEILKTKKAYEVDPTKTKAGSHEIKKNMQFILEKVKQIWQHIQNTANDIPIPLRDIYSRLQNKAKIQFPNSPQARYSVVTGFIFLRFFCAATLNPHLYHVVDEIPDEHASRNLTLISKILMSLANLRIFESKESYLQPANEFITENIPKVKQYIDSIAMLPKQATTVPRVCVNWSKEMAHIQGFLSKNKSQLLEAKQSNKENTNLIKQLESLLQILESFEKMFEDAEKKESSDTKQSTHYSNIGTIHHADLQKYMQTMKEEKGPTSPNNETATASSNPTNNSANLSKDRPQMK